MYRWVWPQLLWIACHALHQAYQMNIHVKGLGEEYGCAGCLLGPASMIISLSNPVLVTCTGSEQTQLRAGIFNNIDYSARHVAPTIESWSMSFHEFQPLPWDIVEDNRIVTYCHVASYSLLLYDRLLTVGPEIELVWPAPWSLGKILYFATTYFAFMDGPLLIYSHMAPPTTSPIVCSLLYKLSGGLLIWGIFVAEAVLIFRTWAIWDRDIRVAVGLMSFMTLLGIATAIFAYMGLGPVKFGPSPRPNVDGCWITGLPKPILFIEYIIVVVFESVILGLTLYKGLQHFRYSRSNLAVTLYRDGTLFYLYLISFSFLNMTIIAIQKAHKPGPSLILMQRILHSILTTRILLNLRQAAAQDPSKISPSNNSINTTLSHQLNRMTIPVPPSSADVRVDVWGMVQGSSTQCMV